MLVVDASVAVAASLVPNGFRPLAGDLIAPPLMWSEATSTLHELCWRGQIDREDASVIFEQLQAAPVRKQDPKALRRTAWDIAEELGWAKTYDAEYLALARLMRTKVVTLDARLRRGADRLGLVIAVDELGS